MYPFASPMMMGVSAAAVGSGWNPSDKGANVTLSNNNQTATGPASGATDTITRGAVGKSAGKWSFRISSAKTNLNFACVSNAIDANNIIPGRTANTLAFALYNGGVDILYNSQGSNLSVSNSGSTIDIIVNVDARKAWFIVGGISVFNGGDPALGTGGYTCPSGTVFPGCDAYNVDYSLTLDTSTSRYAGFAAWG